MSEKRGKKRPKSYYIKCANKKPKRDVWKLEAGMRGFIITCNNNEKGAVREAYNILNEYADKLYGPEKDMPDSKNDEDLSGDEEEEEDIEKAMMKEVKEIKEAKLAQRRFQNTNTRAKNCIFIRTTLPDPSQLAHSILSDLSETKVQKSRYAIRLLPISGSCRAEEGEVKKLGKELFTPIFETPFGKGFSFSIVVKIRNNNGLGRDSVIPALAGIIKELNPLHRVNHDKPDYVILVEVIQSVCCLGIAEDFFKFKKYNLQEIIKGSAENKAEPAEINKEETVQALKDNEEESVQADDKEKVAIEVPEDKEKVAVEVPEDKEKVAVQAPEILQPNKANLTQDDEELKETEGQETKVTQSSATRDKNSEGESVLGTLKVNEEITAKTTTDCNDVSDDIVPVNDPSENS
ncbi:THUMP domain-containing protein 1-like [Ostrea edulis]|uniref:THUMP domain-containing protein 1-like n=1 Tax=Ostrea edulis TaxID=37623 RepID=UPI00209429BC|nr:THUMP domain-containing protein 1-like [Ostrea edulis]